MHAWQRSLGEPEETFEEGDGFFTVGPQEDDLLRGIAPPADRILQVANQFNSRFLEHAGLFPIGLMIPVPDTPDTTHLNVLVHSGAASKLPVSFIEPGRILNDTPVHISEVEATVRPGCRVDESGVEIRGELV